MRLLFITQAVDEQDRVLGFVCGWLAEFSKKFQHISVVCIRKGIFSTKNNVDVYQLGASGKIWKALDFLLYAWKTRSEYDAVFVHMNQEYILIAGILWRILGKKIALWYNHTSGGFLTKIAMFLADVVFHTSPYAFTAGTKKSVRMPAGIDVEKFAQAADIPRAPRSVLYLGRIAPVKGVSVLIDAARVLADRGACPPIGAARFSLTICGDALPRDYEYEKGVHAKAKELVSKGICRFVAGVPNNEAPKMFSANEIFVNLTPAGNYDKTVLEAAACGAIPLVSSPAFRDAFPPELFFEEKNPESLANTIEHIFAMSEQEKIQISIYLRNWVIKTHNLASLAEKILYTFELKAPALRKLASATGASTRNFSAEKYPCSAKQAPKLYYIANARIPTEKAHGIQIAKMCEALLKNGADLTLVIPSRGKNESIKDFYNLSIDIPVVKLPTLPYAAGFIAGSFSFMISAFLFLFLRKMRGEKFIAYTIDMDQFSFSLIPILCVPYFIELHDAKHKGVLFSRFFRNTSGVLTINNIIKNKLCERFNIPNDKVIVAPNGISEEFFNSEKISREDARKMLSMQNYGRVALYAGQFYAWKGLEIFTEVARLAPDIVLYLAGGSREQFEKITGIKNIPENLIFGGIRPYREMPILMRASDALLVLGTKRDEYSYYHTSPMKLFEYLPIGRPIVAAGTPAVKDMVSEREVFFYEPDNAQSFADTIRRAIAEGNGAHQISGARVLAEKYTWASRAQKVISYLAQRAK